MTGKTGRPEACFKHVICWHATSGILNTQKRTLRGCPRVGDFHMLEMPVRTDARVIMPNFEHVHCLHCWPLHHERVFLIPLKVVGARCQLGQGRCDSAPSSISAMKSAADAGVSASKLAIGGEDNNGIPALLSSYLLLNSSWSCTTEMGDRRLTALKSRNEQK